MEPQQNRMRNLTQRLMKGDLNEEEAAPAPPAPGLPANAANAFPVSTIQPDECRHWRFHNRPPDELTEETCRDLIDSMRTERRNLVPIIVRPIDEGTLRYEIIAGARRHYALSFLREREQLDVQLVANIHPNLTDAQAFEIADKENRNREDITPYARALDYAQALDNWYPSQKALASALGMKEPTLSAYLSLAKLPQEIVNAYNKPRDISMRHAQLLTSALRRSTERTKILERASKLRRVNLRRRSAHKEPLSGSEVTRRLVNEPRARTKRVTHDIHDADRNLVGTFAVQHEGDVQTLTLRLNASHHVANDPERVGTTLLPVLRALRMDPDPDGQEPA